MMESLEEETCEDGAIYTNNNSDNFRVSQKPAQGKFSILKDLDTYPFMTMIKTKANEIYNKMHYQTRRGKIRVQLLYHCTYNAHLELYEEGLLDEIPVPDELGEVFNLTSEEVQKCDSLFSYIQTGYEPLSIELNPRSYYKKWCDTKELRLSDDQLIDLLEFSDYITTLDKSLLQNHPRTVASGILKFHLEKSGFVVDPQALGLVTKRSNVTIKGIYDQVSKIYNKK